MTQGGPVTTHERLCNAVIIRTADALNIAIIDALEYLNRGGPDPHPDSPHGERCTCSLSIQRRLAEQRGDEPPQQPRCPKCKSTGAPLIVDRETGAVCNNPFHDTPMPQQPEPDAAVEIAKRVLKLTRPELDQSYAHTLLDRLTHEIRPALAALEKRLAEAETQLGQVIDERDQAENAVQSLDRITGGDGEYRFDTADAWAPSSPALMCVGIAERFTAAVNRAESAEAALGEAHVTIYGMQDGSLLRDTRTRLAAVEAELARTREALREFAIYQHNCFVCHGADYSHNPVTLNGLSGPCPARRET